ncbi:MAG: hypothetical protein JSS49_19920 [Planctomycetes bacterium]|nr:hypothetical protein [Planctomycetota bacterium]
MFRLDDAGQEQTVWSKALVNFPSHAFVADRGKYVVTVDTYADMGREHSIVVYDDQGKVRADYKLEDFLTDVDIRDRVPTSSANRWWTTEADFNFVLDSRQFTITTNWGAVVTVNLESGHVEKSGQSLLLVLTEDFYSPTAGSKGVLKCILRNDSIVPFRIPVGFHEGIAELHAGSRTKMFLSKSVSEDGEMPESPQAVLRVAKVKPRSELMLFEFPLEEILAKGDKPNRDWKWTWPNPKTQPLSPIHRFQKAGYLDEVRFQARLRFGKYDFLSNRVVLKVKSDAS